MNRPHPNRPYAALAAALLASVALGGCRGQQTAMTNPFLSPDRVPPPSTRMVPPGTAAPYYSGDPLPSAQTETVPAAAVDSFAASEPAGFDAPARAIVASGESPVAIPGDSDDLRFALPAPPTVAEAEPTPLTPSTTVAAVQNPSYAPANAVAPAVYNEADPYQVMPADSVAADNGPWRSPQIPPSNGAPTFAQNVQPASAQSLGVHPMATQPLATQPANPAADLAPLASLPPPPAAAVDYTPQQTMPVELRAVPSPPLEVATSAAPRIRFADATAPVIPQNLATNNPVAPAAYYATTPNGVVQPVQVALAQPGPVYWLGGTPGIVAQPPTNQPANPPASPDGFRPRGSTW